MTSWCTDRSLVALALVGVLGLAGPLGPLGAPDVASAQAPDPAALIATVNVRIVGRQATSGIYLQRSMRSKVGQPFDPQLFDNDVQRLRNYEVFRSVEGHVDRRDDGVHLEVVVEDRWTIIPVFRPVIAAGIVSLKLGLRDSNFLGRNMDLALYGGPYFSPAENSWVAGFDWMVRQFAGRHVLDSTGGRDYFVDSYYNYQNGEPASDIRVETLFGQATIWFRPDEFARVPIQPGVGAYVGMRRYSLLRGAEPEDGLAANTFAIRPRLSLRVGRVDFEDYRYEGYEVEVGAMHQISVRGTPSYWGGDIQGRFFLRPLPRLNLAFRIRGDVRNNGHSADDVTYGGLDRVRGFPFNWVRGKRGALLNSEARILVHDSIWDVFFFQIVALYDVAIIGDRFGARLAHSAGLGSRIAVIPVFGMFSRVDVARSLSDGSLSFDVAIGIREFF